MEILIPGLILVALMVWASTKIKKSAAAAYAEERFETDDFSIIKPEGFIIPVRDDSPLAFEAYTKDFGRDDSAAFRHVSAEVTVSPEGDLDAAVERVKREAVRVADEVRSNGTGRACRLQADELKDGLTIEAFHKFIENGPKIYHLRILALPEHKGENLRKIEQMLDSFALK